MGHEGAEGRGGVSSRLFCPILINPNRLFLVGMFSVLILHPVLVNYGLECLYAGISQHSFLKGVPNAFWHLFTLPRTAAWMFLASLMIYAAIVSFLRWGSGGHGPDRAGGWVGDSARRAIERAVTHVLDKIYLLVFLLDTKRFSRFRQAHVVTVYMVSTLVACLLRGVTHAGQERVQQLAARGALGSGSRAHQGVVLLAILVIATEQGVLGSALRRFATDGDRRSLQLLGLSVEEGLPVILEALLCILMCGAFSVGEEVEWDSVTISHRLRASFGIMTRALELVQHIHVWCLRGLGLGLVDMALFLRLHWIVLHIVLCCRDLCNIFTAGKRVDLYCLDATPAELSRQSSDDVCAVCLKRMVRVVKKLPECGHLFHRHCIARCLEVQDRARGARCPLCRREIFRRAARRKQLATEGRQGSSTTTSPGDGPGEDSASNPDSSSPAAALPTSPPTTSTTPPSAPAANHTHERALFRFSTDGWRLASWFPPIPAFSLEIVQRRPPSPPPPPPAAAGRDQAAADSAGG